MDVWYYGYSEGMGLIGVVGVVVGSLIFWGIVGGIQRALELKNERAAQQVKAEYYAEKARSGR
jgi:hypothetical protein